MSELFAKLNSNSGALSAIFSGVVTIATVIYAWLTAKLVQETRQMRAAQTEPRVEVTYKVRDEWINLMDIEIRNIGVGPAYDIKLTIRAETHSAGTTELERALLALGSFKKGLTYLGPSQHYSSFWTNLAEGSSTKIDSRFSIVCTYRSLAGTQYNHDCIVDISELKGSIRVGEPPLQKIAKQMEKLEKDFSQLTRGRIKVDVYTASDRKETLPHVKDQITGAPRGDT